jgi:type IV secretory pathway VirJ component
MEPKLPASNLGPERSPVVFGQNLESAPLPPNPETNIERHAERFEQRSEATPAAVNAAPILPAPITVPLPSIGTDDVAVQPATDNTPLIANDDDLIEKEWVDQAKKIIVQTKDDPYKREQEVNKLQADYLRKRYGRELGASQ